MGGSARTRVTIVQAESNQARGLARGNERTTEKVRSSLSTLGVAHHQSGTFPQIDSDAECAARTARYAAQDAAYRAVLGLNPEEPLPRSIGRHPMGGPHRRGYEDQPTTGGRRRLKSATL